MNLHNTKVVYILHIGSANDSITSNFKEEDGGMVTKQVRPDYMRAVEDALRVMAQNNHNFLRYE